VNVHACSPASITCNQSSILFFSVKLLDWGEEGHRSDAEIASLRAAFTQEVAVWHKLDHPNVTKVILLLHSSLALIMFVLYLVLWERVTPFNRWYKFCYLLLSQKMMNKMKGRR